MRPRANTISHTGGASVFGPRDDGSAVKHTVQPGHSRHASMIGLNAHDSQFLADMSQAMGQRGLAHGLSKLDTNGLTNLRMGGGMRTAPVNDQLMQEFDWDMFSSSGNTVNPNALHYNDSPQSMAVDSVSSYQHVFPDMTTSQTMDENFEWMNSFQHQLDFTGNENAVGDGSSPSAMSTPASHSAMSEVMLDGSNQPVTSSSIWQQTLMAPAMTPANPFGMDFAMTGFPDFLNGGQISPNTQAKQDQYFSTPPPSMSSLSPSFMPGMLQNGMHHTLNFGPETPQSLNGSIYSSPVSTITEATRQALVVALNQMTPFGGRKNSFASYSAPPASQFGRQVNDNARNLPSTADLQRYVAAYLRYFQPHLPFLHLPTLSFEVQPQQIQSARYSGAVGGRGCLLLSMAAIGALYEMDQPISREIFELAKKMIQLYLEERRKADVRKADMRKTGVPEFGQLNGENTVHTPVWLVQAMLLNVIYGHNCGDKTAGDIAATHCAALVSLCRSAGLLEGRNGTSEKDLNVTDDTPMADTFINGNKEDMSEEQREWINWRIVEERKRTLFTVFALSSLLVSAFNHTPALTNNEITLELPCEEEFWGCESAAAFNAKGGVKAATQNVLVFNDALQELLRAGQKQTNGFVNGSPSTTLRPSTFGCFVLINALHNHIWETRQRHHNKMWTNEESENMHHSIEPALKAWQEAWASNPNHSLGRPNPYGFGALSADSIPLLDLAYVRLFVNLSRSKEKFWQRDFDGMSEEIQHGPEITQHAEHSPGSNLESNSDPSDMSSAQSGFGDSPHTSDFGFTKPNLVNDLANSVHSLNGSQLNNNLTKRERHLRKAAFYAADSLSMSDKLGVTFADFTSRELPLQSALCAFDCAQVLAEWVATVQERVGPYVGILGRDGVDFSTVPGIMLLEEEDIKLLGKIQEVLQGAEVKMNFEAGIVGMDSLAAQQRCLSEESGYGAKILRVTAFMLDKAAVWPSKLPSLFSPLSRVLAAAQTSLKTENLGECEPG